VTDNAKVSRSQAQRQHVRKRSHPDVLKSVQRWSEQSEPVAAAEPPAVPQLSRPSRKNSLDISDHTKKESRWESATTSRVVDLDQPRNPSRKTASPDNNAPGRRGPVDRLPTVAEKGNHAHYTIMQTRSSRTMPMVSTDILCAAPHLGAASSPEMTKGRLSFQPVEQNVQRALDIVYNS
jgi:hypothetical protein